MAIGKERVSVVARYRRDFGGAFEGLSRRDGFREVSESTKEERKWISGVIGEAALRMREMKTAWAVPQGK